MTTPRNRKFTICWTLEVLCYLALLISRQNLVRSMPLDKRGGLPGSSRGRGDFSSPTTTQGKAADIPEFMIRNYKDMNRHYCDRRVIRSVPGQAAVTSEEEEAKFRHDPRVLSFIVTPFQKDEEMPYSAEIHLAFRGSGENTAEPGNDTSSTLSPSQQAMLREMMWKIAIWTADDAYSSPPVRSGRTARSTSSIIPANDSHPVFDDILTVPIIPTKSMSRKKNDTANSEKETVIDLHSTEIISKLSSLGDDSSCRIIMEIRPISTSAAELDRLQPMAYFVLHSLRKRTKCNVDVDAATFVEDISSSVYRPDTARSKRSASSGVPPFPPRRPPLSATRRRGTGGEDGILPWRDRQKMACHKRTLYVDFEVIGWDQWIVAPTGYWANYCDGNCPYPMNQRLNSTNHAILQSLLHLMIPDMRSSCCTPIKLRPISILYMDENNNLVLKQYEDMVVESCGCR